MTTDSEPGFSRLADIEAPSGLAKVVVARVSRLAEERPPAWLATGAAVRVSPGRPSASPRWRLSDVAAAIIALAGLALVAVAWTQARPDATTWKTVFFPTLGGPFIARLPLALPAAVSLGLGMALYLAGLFAPLREHGTRRRG